MMKTSITAIVARRQRRPVTDRERSAKKANIGIIALTRHGVGLALQIQAKLPGSTCYVPSRHQFALAMGARGFNRLAEVFADLWGDCRALVCIMATGIVVRLVAPLLRHKSQDPAVVVLDERGQFAISLVSGHLGGANRLAHEVAAITGGQAVITTASDVQGRPALDLLAQRLGMAVENPALLARAARALLEEERIWVFDPERRLMPYLAEASGVRWLSREELDRGDLAPDRLGIWVSELQPPSSAKCLLLRPRNLVVGVGCNRGTKAEEILGLIQEAFSDLRLALPAIRNLASIDLKEDEPGLVEAAHTLQRPVQFYSRDQLESMNVPNPSATVQSHIGVASVCEAAALLSAGGQGRARLVAGKRKTANATVAVARVD
ncbi:MAG TPA: cobalamin biosynthesis protein CbiG [Syntrophobacteraceae bacterium]|nr:cobalamin biosynthesis protein CbiG [Syntrophobacteraceae bacterium]